MMLSTRAVRKEFLDSCPQGRITRRFNFEGGYLLVAFGDGWVKIMVRCESYGSQMPFTSPTWSSQDDQSSFDAWRESAYYWLNAIHI